MFLSVSRPYVGWFISQKERFYQGSCHLFVRIFSGRLPGLSHWFCISPTGSKLHRREKVQRSAHPKVKMQNVK